MVIYIPVYMYTRIYLLNIHIKIFIKFNQSHSGHCKKLAPEYAAAAKELKKLQEPIYLAKVDATS